MTGPLPAVAFLTRLPVGVHPSREQIASATAWFPAVGLLLGLLLLAVDRLAMRALPPAAVDVLLVVALAALTGALHLDGLADSADGLLGGYSPERRLEIMRDVHTGTFGVVAVVSVLALKWAGFNALPSDVRVEAIVLAPCLARFAMLITIAFPYAREDGVGSGYREHIIPALAVGGLTAALVTIALLGASGAYALIAGAGGALLIGALALRMLGGVTGDIFGATVEVMEAALLLFIAAFANRGWIDAWLLA